MWLLEVKSIWIRGRNTETNATADSGSACWVLVSLIPFELVLLHSETVYIINFVQYTTNRFFLPLRFSSCLLKGDVAVDLGRGLVSRTYSITWNASNVLQCPCLLPNRLEFNLRKMELNGYYQYTKPKAENRILFWVRYLKYARLLYVRKFEIFWFVFKVNQS
jgi:hypothetical protein